MNPPLGVPLVVLALLCAPGLAWAAEGPDAAVTEPLVALGAGLLIASQVSCVAPAVLNTTFVARSERSPTGLLAAGTVCAGLGLAAGIPFALRDEPAWQRGIGIASAVMGGVSLAMAIAAHAMPPPKKKKAAALRVWLAPTVLSDGRSPPAMGLVLSVGSLRAL